MIEVEYTRRFLRDLSKLTAVLQEEVLEKVELFKNERNHRQLRAHKLKGELRGKLSFSVNYSYRIMFECAAGTKKTVILLTIGDHSIYS